MRRAWPVYRQAIHRQLTARLTPQQCRELAALLGQVIATDDLDPPVTIGGRGKKADVEARCNELRRQIKETTSDYDREKLEERLAKLAGGVAVIHVGAPSEAEMKNRKEAFDDAISATKAAIAEGIVPGGGLVLLRAIDALEVPPPGADAATVAASPAVACASARSCMTSRPPSTAASACTAVRTRLFDGCCAVSDTPAVCVWKRISHERGSFAPYLSRISVAQMRRAARYFAISSKKSLWALKKNEICGTNASTSRPASSAICSGARPAASARAARSAARERALPGRDRSCQRARRASGLQENKCLSSLSRVWRSRRLERVVNRVC